MQHLTSLYYFKTNADQMQVVLVRQSDTVRLLFQLSFFLGGGQLSNFPLCIYVCIHTHNASYIILILHSQDLLSQVCKVIEGCLGSDGVN